jgi:hypothetical protein
MRGLWKGSYLVLRCGAPVRNARWVGDAFLQSVGTEGAEGDGSSAVETADGPEGRHCGVWLVGSDQWMSES